MLATLGDLVDDIVVQLAGPINVATDTSSIILRRRGGSAANVAATAGVLGQPARFLGQVGTDAVGAAWVAELEAAGVDTQFVLMGDGNMHSPHNLPVVLLGSAAGAHKPGAHVRAKFDDPFMNLCLSVLDTVDVHLDQIGDSTGRQSLQG